MNNQIAKRTREKKRQNTLIEPCIICRFSVIVFFAYYNFVSSDETKGISEGGNHKKLSFRNVFPKLELRFHGQYKIIQQHEWFFFFKIREAFVCQRNFECANTRLSKSRNVSIALQIAQSHFSNRTIALRNCEYRQRHCLYRLMLRRLFIFP